MLRSLAIAVLPLLVFLMLAACKKEHAWDCFKSNGDLKTETRYPGEFTSLEVFDKMDITIVPGSGYKIELKAGEHLLKNITTTIQDQRLSIKNTNTCNFVRGYKKKIEVIITVPAIQNIINRGVGDMHVSGFVQDSLQVDAESSGDIYVSGVFKQLSAKSNGNGDIYLDGTCNNLYGYLQGTNFLHAETLTVTGYLNIQTVSVGDCFLNAGAVNTLEVTIWRIGNIYYKGMPNAIIRHYEENCKGRLIPGN